MRKKTQIIVGVVACLMAVLMLAGAWLVLELLALEQLNVRRMLLFAMSVPQLVTGIAGIALAKALLGRLRNV